MTTKRISSFRDQRVFWTFAIFLIVFAFTTGVLWSHLDNVLNPGTYRLMARAGLFRRLHFAAEPVENAHAPASVDTRITSTIRRYAVAVGS